jgi:hypothetical protein
MNKAVIFRNPKAQWLAGRWFGFGWRRNDFRATGNTWEILLATVVTPLVGVLYKVAWLIVRERGNVTVAEVDAEFDTAPKK